VPRTFQIVDGEGILKWRCCCLRRLGKFGCDKLRGCDRSAEGNDVARSMGDRYRTVALGLGWERPELRLSRLVGAYAALVEEEDLGAAGFGCGQQRRVGLVQPGLDRLGVAFVRAPQRLLRRDPQTVQPTADRGDVQGDP
jgi:hypothetical protein